jgi:hypothetical protein
VESKAFVEELEATNQDQLARHGTGKALLVKYATTPDSHQSAKDAATRTLEIAMAEPRRAAPELGTQCVSGC